MSEQCTYNEVPYYVDAFQYFLAHSTYGLLIKENIENCMLPTVQHLLQQEKITILSIGPGIGTPDLLLLKALDALASAHQHSIRVYYTLVEPSDGFMALLKSNIASLSKELKNVELTADFQQCKVEEFFALANISFDLVLLIHSLYYMDVDTVLSKVYDILSEGGSTFIEVGNGWSDMIGEVFQAVCTRVIENVSQWNIRDQIIAFFERKGCSISKHVKSYEIDFTECFNFDSTDGTRFMEFCAHVSDIKEKLGKDGYNSFLSSLRKCLHKDNESRWWGTRSDALMIVNKTRCI